MREPRFYENPSCAEIGGDFWFPDNEIAGSSADAQYAKAICAICPHKKECMEWGIANETHGIWGGINNRTRQLIRRQRGIKIHSEGENVA